MDKRTTTVWLSSLDSANMIVLNRIRELSFMVLVMFLVCYSGRIKRLSCMIECIVTVRIPKEWGRYSFHSPVSFPCGTLVPVPMSLTGVALVPDGVTPVPDKDTVCIFREDQRGGSHDINKPKMSADE